MYTVAYIYKNFACLVNKSNYVRLLIQHQLIQQLTLHFLAGEYISIQWMWAILLLMMYIVFSVNAYVDCKIISRYIAYFFLLPYSMLC